VSSSDDIIKRAKELEMLRKLKESGQLPQENGQTLVKTMQVLEMKMDLVNRKLDELLHQRKTKELKEVHQKILNVLHDWMNTQNLAQALGYRQEYVSRKVAELKEMGKIDEKREGKNLFYRKVG
jgi:DNA-binding transcriptional ArsR family regulator